MVKIKKLVKKKGGLFVINCNGVNYDVHENTIIKLNLLSDNVKCSEISNEISYYNEYYHSYSTVLKSIAKKALCEQEVRKLLKDCEPQVIEDICNELKANNLVNDEVYAKLFINSYATNNKYSSRRIINELDSRQIIVSEVQIAELQALDFDKAFKIVEKLCAQTKDKSRIEFLNKCKLKLQSYSYAASVIEDVLSTLDYDETAALQNACYKLCKRYDKNKVKQKLYSRGFDYQLIKEELND